MQKISVKLLRAEKLANDVYEFEFGREAGRGSEADRGEAHGGNADAADASDAIDAIEFEPGQFMLLNVQDGKEPPVSRAYSIAGRPYGNFLFCIKLIPGGRGSEYLRGLDLGDSVQLQGPTGHFTLGLSGTGQDEKDLILVATGVGIAPFMCMLRQMFAGGSVAEHAQRKIFLHFGVRNEEDVFYKEQLDAWKAAHENFDYTLTLSRPAEEWTGAKGRVTDHLAKQFESVDAARTEIFICGNGSMVKEVKEMAEEKGFAKADLHFELFTPVVAK